MPRPPSSGDADGDQLRLDHRRIVADVEHRQRQRAGALQQVEAVAAGGQLPSFVVALHRLGQAGEVAAGEVGEQPAHGVAVRRGWWARPNMMHRPNALAKALDGPFE